LEGENITLKSFKKIGRVLTIGEKEVFSDVSKIISIAAKANTILIEMVKENYGELALANEMEAVKALEKESDKIAFEISEDVTSGAISPNLIDNLLDCVSSADNIVDLYYYISREMNRMSKTHSLDLRAHLEVVGRAIYGNMFSLAEESLEKLQKMLSASSELETTRLRREIEDLEEHGDEVKDDGFDKLYSMSPKITYLQFYHYSELLHKCDDILDACEDLSQLVVSIVTSILK
jgi:uncharacterized protein Yka (UPF0111/DUF47 family)